MEGNRGLIRAVVVVIMVMILRGLMEVDLGRKQDDSGRAAASLFCVVMLLVVVLVIERG